MADPVTVTKVAIKVASILKDEEKRKTITIASIISVITVLLLILLVPIYLIVAPLSAIKDIITGDLSLGFVWDLRKLTWGEEEGGIYTSSNSGSYNVSPIYHGIMAMPVIRACKITSLYGFRTDPVTRSKTELSIVGLTLQEKTFMEQKLLPRRMVQYHFQGIKAMDTAIMLQ